MLERQADSMAAEVLRARPAGTPPSALPGIDGSPPAAGLVPPGGRPLDPGTRRFFEPRFGVALGAVRVHTGPAAAQTAAAQHARAFTAGRHIVFGKHRYSPATAHGRRLLAHELTHVVQQTGPIEHTRMPSGGRGRGASPALAPRISRAPSGIIQREEDGEAAAADDRVEAYVYVYAQDDPQFRSVWRRSAEFFARSRDTASTGGLPVEGGSTTGETLRNILDAYDAESFQCIRAIEFFGHGTPGDALSGGFEPADIAAAEELAAASEMDRDLEALITSESAVQQQLDLHERFTELRGLLCSDSYFHFRSCETLRGEEGEAFGRETAARFGTNVLGYTEIIDTILPGPRTFDPQGTEGTALPAELMPGRQPVAELPFGHFEIEIDTTSLTIPDVDERIPIFTLGEAWPTVVLGAEVRNNPADPATYLLRLEIQHPRAVRLPELGHHLARLLPESPGGDEGPTADVIREWLDEHGTEGRYVEVPIDHRIVRAFTEAVPSLTFQLENEDYGSATITIRGVEAAPSPFQERGGVHLGTDIGALFAGGEAGILARPFVHLPLLDWRSVFRVGLELGAPFGRETIAGEARLPITFQTPEVTGRDIAPRISIAPLLGYGAYLGRTGFTGGVHLEAGTRISGVDLALGGSFLASPHPGLSGTVMLRAAWVFE